MPEPRLPLPVDFDAGLNSSTAWKKHLSITDAEPSPPSPPCEQKPILARAIRDVAGNEENRELDLKAGENVEILNPHLGDDWSLARKPSGDMGLVPCDCYVAINDFSSSSFTPQSSRITSPGDGPIKMQSTGESIITSSLNSIRRSVLSGRSLNRFSHFVTTGAEDWILHGHQTADNQSPKHERFKSDSTLDGSDLGVSTVTDADWHYVETGPTWRQKTPPFRVLVHSPSKCSSVTGAFTLYSVTSIFQPEGSDNPTVPPGVPFLRPELVAQSSSSTRITVHRRFSHFAFLHTALTRKLPGIALPPLPAKQYAGRFQDEFVEARRGDLEKWLGRVARHPVARYSEVLTFFLGCESDLEWKRLLPRYLNTLPAGPAFYAHVFHPEFNLDVEECAHVVERFEKHVKAVDGRVGVLRSVMGGFREARNVMSGAQRELSMAFLGLISEGNKDKNDEHEDSGLNGHASIDRCVNDEGAWCWHDQCEDCLQMTKGLQKMAECMQLVADLHEDSARRSMLNVHDMMKDASNPSLVYAPLVDTHKSALERYQENEEDSGKDNATEIAGRCETVLNTTMAEFDTYHAQRGEDFTQIAVEYLDSEIELYEQVLQKLKAARRVFTPEGAADLPSGPRKPSIYEKHLCEAGPRPSVLLPQPTAHVYDAAPIRPMSAVGMLIDGLAGSGSGFRDAERGSGLKFWS
ncbi:hypothetical protein CTheo_5021 [Ceratobasidium theobromae]|uniref:Sorting nexin lst-4 n=1 Tax=Ceratobasidium theobromae TaxID=1582974 RepID=A0A5N5QIP8_9AGAM|nr:hypothetical protein CTheo_5021 [Ceratobasidium theobromae]